jgi:5-methylcytosine-specific restriction protein A
LLFLAGYIIKIVVSIVSPGQFYILKMAVSIVSPAKPYTLITILLITTISMKKKICCQAGCNNLIDQSERYCPQHKREPREPFNNAIRFNEELYRTTQWRTLRKEVLNEQQCCFKCEVSKSESKLEVHHIIPPRGNEELFFDKSNLVAVCPVCHKIITSKEIGNRRRG